MKSSARLAFARFVLAALCIGQIVCLVPAGAEDKLSPQIRDAISDARFRHAHWGILVADRRTGDTVYEFDADKLFPPASTTKLYSVAAALDALGSDYRFETPIYRRGAVNAKGELQGDLILVAASDLTLGGRTTSTGEIEYTNLDHTYANVSSQAVLTSADPLAGLDGLARQVAAAGIRSVQGQILVDARLFDPANSTGSGPVRLSPILVNDDLIDFTILPTKAGSQAKVDLRPLSASLDIDAAVETVAAGGETKIEIEPAGENRFIVRGRIAADRGRIVLVQEVADPARWARSLFIEALQRAGVTVSASAYEPNRTNLLPKQGDQSSLVQVAVLKSPPFSENVRLVLKVSHNLHASTLPLLIAVRHGKRQLADGLRLERDFLRRAGLDADSISFGGGAGGAQGDYTTPRMNVALLRYLATRTDFAVFERGLPILGVDGTLADDVSTASPARKVVRAKTGTLVWQDLMNGRYLLTSKALAGYLTAKSGRELVVSFVVSGVPIDKPTEAKSIGKVLAHLCEIVQQAN